LKNFLPRTGTGAIAGRTRRTSRLHAHRTPPGQRQLCQQIGTCNGDEVASATHWTAEEGHEIGDCPYLLKRDREWRDFPLAQRFTFSYTFVFAGETGTGNLIFNSDAKQMITIPHLNPVENDFLVTFPSAIIAPYTDFSPPGGFKKDHAAITDKDMADTLFSKTEIMVPYK